MIYYDTYSTVLVLYFIYAHMFYHALLALITWFTAYHAHMLLLCFKQDRNAMLKLDKLDKMKPQWASSPEYIVYTQGWASLVSAGDEDRDLCRHCSRFHEAED